MTAGRTLFNAAWVLVLVFLALPIVIVLLEPLEPQPAMRSAAASITKARIARGSGAESVLE